MLDQELLAKAEANDVQAIFEVAKAYYIGDGVEENNDKAFELFSKVVALDPNFPDVYSRIGRCYEKGWGTAQDLKKAVDAYTTGANLNSAGCHYYLALAYENGTGVAQDEQKAIQHYKIAADLGDTDSMVEMGHRYRAGNGVEKDDVIATEYYRKAAEKDDSNGVYQLARAYYDGLGVEKDVPRSTQLWEKSAELGHWGAQFYTGINYLTGDGVEKDAKKAAFWFEKAAEQEHPDATYKLGALYLDGVGVERDPTKGIAYIIQAANLGASDAYFLAGVTYFQGNYGYPVDKAKAIEYWTKGSEAGEGGCTKNLGIVYKTGDGAERDPAKALAYFEKAAEQGNIDALEQLGLAYVGGGISGTHDEEKALEYFERAYKAGSADGAYFLGLLLETGEQVEHDLARAYSVYLFAAERGNSDAMIKIPVKSAHSGPQGRTRRLHLHPRSLRFTIPKLLGILVQAHAGLLLAERLHLAEQDFLFGCVERVTPAFFRTVSLAEVQFQRVTQTILLHVIVGVDVEPVIVLIGADECTEGGIHIEVRLQIKVELTVRFDDLLTEGKILCREMTCRGNLFALQMIQQFVPLIIARCEL